MDINACLRGGGIFIALIMTLASNLEDNIIVRLGFDSNLAFIIFAALLLTCFVTGRHGLVIGAIIIFSLNANMPADFSLNMGFDRDLYTGIMLALVLQPVTVKMLF